MRRPISFVIAFCLIVAGAVGMAYPPLFMSGWNRGMVLGSGMVFTAGVVWLYADFTEPAPGEED